MRGLHCRRLLNEAYVCGLDAEWIPNARTASASVLQLAFRSRQQSRTTTLVLVRLPLGVLHIFQPGQLVHTMSQLS